MIVPVIEAVARSITQPLLLALAIWREARGAGEAGMVAVAYAIMNRVERPSWWGTTLEEVLGKKWQISSLTAPGDPQLILWPRSEDPSWREALAVARAVLNKAEPNPFPGADSYFDSSIAAPKWTATATFKGEIKTPVGNMLRFYDVDHDHEAEALVAAGAATDFDAQLKAFLSAPSQGNA